MNSLTHIHKSSLLSQLFDKRTNLFQLKKIRESLQLSEANSTIK